MKRAFDIVLSALGLAVLWPVLLLIAAGVKLTSPGPVLFRQERVGHRGRPFWICKFRSMRVRQGGPLVTSGNDHRITRFGRLLRRTKLDELPQLLNVLFGEMSFVGPRPEVPEFVAMYPAAYARVLAVRPGITHPGTLRFRREEQILAAVSDPRRFYIQRILPAKLAAYESGLRQGLLQDVRTIVLTMFPVLADRPYELGSFLPAPIRLPVPGWPASPSAAAATPPVPALAPIPGDDVPADDAAEAPASAERPRRPALI